MSQEVRSKHSKSLEKQGQAQGTHAGGTPTQRGTRNSLLQTLGKAKSTQQVNLLTSHGAEVLSFQKQTTGDQLHHSHIQA